jgi:DNA-binding HxlR family transcriptional regulator
VARPAKRAPGAQAPATPAAKRNGAAPAAPAARGESRSPAALDRVIHERVRLAIVSALAGAPSLTFNELKALLDITDGNLSVHARKLEDAGFVACDKTFVDRVPRTAYRLTAAGRKALDAYIGHMEALIQRIRDR